MDLDARASEVKFLIRDRGANFTASFDAVFTTAGMRIIKTPVQAPLANAIAERWISSCRREATDKILILGQRHLRTVLTEYIDHYDRHRPHRTLQQRPPDAPNKSPSPPSDPIKIVRSARRSHRVTRFSAPTGLGDEAFMIDGANDTTITAKLLGRWRNAFVLTDYTGSVRSTPNSVFSHRGLTQTQNAEAAATRLLGRRRLKTVPGHANTLSKTTHETGVTVQVSTAFPPRRERRGIHTVGIW